MRYFLVTVCLVFAASVATAAEEGFTSLFDGKTFNGWEGNLQSFRIEDGAIVGGSLKARVPHNEFLCNRKEYGDFELRLKFRLLGAGANGGVQIRSRRVPNHYEVSGYQADMGDGYWGCLYDESRRNTVLAGPPPAERSKVAKLGDWYDYVIRCQGRRIQLWVNGRQTVNYTEPDEKLPLKGIIGLQIHGGEPSEAWYKEIRIKESSGARAAGPLAPLHIEETPRGAIAESARFRAEIRDGVLVSFFNKLTQEEYLAQDARPDALLPHLPSGLGTQNTNSERESARKLFEWPWWEHPTTAGWPNQHYPTTASAFAFEAKEQRSALLTYRGLSNGVGSFADESFALELAIDAESGDLLVTPAAESPRGGVYGCGFTLTALAPQVTVEAPLFEGMRLDRHMQPSLSVNQWGNFWDYAFAALNGEKTGAVGLWCQDRELKVYKTLFYLINEQGLSLSVQCMNRPPFNQLKSAGSMTWRLQAFDKSWAQAAARFRDWRLKNVKIAPRPDWVKKLAFMEYGMDKASPVNETAMLEKYFGGQDLDRVLTWAPAVRRAGFDVNHANNDPYPGFRKDMQGWKAKHLKLMVYLQPMIMWGPNPQTDRERQAVAFSAVANTRSPFRANLDTVDLKHDQHNLGCPQWQRWFLDWVREYIQSYGADGIYHDQSYCCPIDVRGAAAPGGMTSPQGMADYFYKAATENPGSIHGTEHMTEVNNVGASMGLGCGIIWGTPGYQGRIGPAGSMNRQRIKKASPVCNALHSPNGAIFGFPHQSNYSEFGAVRFHHGMDQMERRGDLPAIPLGCYGFFMGGVPYDQCANEVWLDRQRALAFVHYGLRPVFPENWARNVLTYFKGANGEDFRYEQMPWGTAFVQYSGGQRKLQYGRINGVTRAAVEGAILGWPCYDERGLTGLNPDESATYCLDPAGQRPPAWFSLPADDVYVADGFANEDLAYFQLQPIPSDQR